MSLRTISYGGGVQSTALVVLAAQGVIDYPVALFSNVGDDSEYPATIDYVRNIERVLNERRVMLGKDPVWLTRFNKPLDEAIAEAQDTLPWPEGPEGCDEGYCWT